MPESEINAESKARADELAREISGYLADGEPVIVKLPSTDQEDILSERFENLFGDVEVIQVINLGKSTEELLSQMIELNLLEQDQMDNDIDDVVTYTPVDVVFGDVSQDIVDKVGRQHYFITGLLSFASTTNSENNSDTEEGRQADRDKFSIALGVRQAMKTSRAFSIIFSGEKTASDYYHQNITMQRMMDELIPPPPKTQVIKSDLN